VNSVVTIGLYDSVGRARPSYEDCQKDPRFVGCTTSPTASFPSGHTAEAFAAAGMSCANHLYVPIYYYRSLDVLACVRDVTLATTESLLRVIGDRHYMTDVLAGATIGFSIGYFLPTLLHYRARGKAMALSWTVSPIVSHRSSGLLLVGSFL
jgi:membrane-associated phospholipid phosphatase